MADTSTRKEPRRKSPIKNNRAKEKGHTPRFTGLKKLAPGDSRSYIDLRIALDSFQAMALVYYADGKSSKERKNRADEIRRAVKKAVKPWKQPAQTFQASLMAVGYDNGCWPGYCDCNGFCIPQGQPCY